MIGSKYKISSKEPLGYSFKIQPSRGGPYLRGHNFVLKEICLEDFKISFSVIIGMKSHENRLPFFILFFLCKSN